MSMQRPGYPNVSVKLYEDYDAWQENRFLELATTLTTLTMRDGLFGRNEGILQFYDNRNLHTRMNGEQIIQVSVSNANSKTVLTRVYGCKHFAVSVDEKGDNIIAIELAPIHIVQNLKFSRAFFANATETITEMVRVIFRERELIATQVDGINVYVPRVAWVSNLSDFMQYTREIGMAVESEQFVFVWEDILGIHIQDYPWMVAQEPEQMVVGEPNQIGDFIGHMKVPLAYDFVWLTKANQHTRNPIENATIYAYSFNDKKIERITNGDGNNSIVVSRSGGYSELTYRNGFEEASRLMQMSQYDGYASCKTSGNFEITPGKKIIFGDPKQQFKTEFFVDEVVHEISSNSSVTTLYMFTNGKGLTPVEPIKVKNELASLNTAQTDQTQPEEPQEPEPGTPEVPTNPETIPEALPSD